jgi:hypothetical protein
MQTTFSNTKRPPRPIVIAAIAVSFAFGWWYYAQTEGAPALA